MEPQQPGSLSCAVEERLRANAERRRPLDPACWPTPGQFVSWWDTLTESERFTEAERIIELRQARFYAAINPHQLDGDDVLKLKHPCPDCGSTLEIPVNAIRRPEGRNTVMVTFEVDESFIELVSEHAMTNPDQHPTFVHPVEKT